MLKGIWSRGSSSGNSAHLPHHHGLGMQKNENIDPSNMGAVIANRGNSMDMSSAASSKIGMGTNHLNMSHTGINMIQFKNQKTIGKSELVDQSTGIGTLSANIQDPKILSTKNSTASQQIQGRSFSVNRAFKDITNKVLNSSGAAVIQNNLPATNSSSSGAIGGGGH